MAGKIYREENNVYQIDCSKALWSTDELNDIFHNTGVSILSDVDFIFETEEDIIFVEYKNANISGAVNPDAFKPSEDKSVNKIAYKFYDSLIYILACGHKKPLKYVYILEYQKGDSTTRKFIRNRISEKLPFRLQKVEGIKKELISSFDVLSIEEWNNSNLYSNFPISLVDG